MNSPSLSAVDLLAQLIRIPSVNPMGGPANCEHCFEHRLSDWLEDYFRQLGIPCERLVVVPSDGQRPARDNIVARYDSSSSAPLVLLDAHQDTVSVEGMSEPFCPRLRQGRMFGRGACDVKGGLAAMLAAFTRLFRERPKAAANVVLSCTCDEEATALGVRDLISYWTGESRKSQLLAEAPQACIVAEPTALNVVVSHRGVLRFRVRTRGVACHASNPTQGKNAIYRMAPVLTFLEEYANGLAERMQTDAFCGRPALSVGLIQGGTAANIVPAECVIDVDRRLIPGEDPTQVWQEISESLDRFDDAVCDPPWLAAPPLGQLDNGHLAAELVRVLSGLRNTPPRIVGAAYCTNASTISSADVPAVVFGPGSIAQAHTDEEYVEIEQLEQAAEAYYQFCCSYRL